MIRKNSHIIILLVFAIFVFGNYADAESDSLAVYYDQSELDIRLPDKQALDDYRDDPDFNYDVNPAPPESFWDKVWYKIGKIIDWVFNGSPWGTFIAWTVISLVVLLIILRLLKTPLKSLFVGSKYDRDISIQEIEEEASEAQIDEKILECISSKQFRLATRLLYIKLLKRLSLKEIIIWQIDKTNRDYRIELLNTRYTEQFNKLSSLYDYVWYGDFKIENATFTDVFDQYNNFFKQLNEE